MLLISEDVPTGGSDRGVHSEEEEEEEEEEEGEVGGDEMRKRVGRGGGRR